MKKDPSTESVRRFREDQEYEHESMMRGLTGPTKSRESLQAELDQLRKQIADRGVVTAEEGDGD
jgi:cell division septation protein DedD